MNGKYPHAIPAKKGMYKGIEFRSLLEVKWVQFLDSIGVEWLYEPKHFVLDSGPYLPDLWLPKKEVWAEIKPVYPPPNSVWRLMELVSRTGHPAILLVGEPSNKPCTIFKVCRDMQNDFYKGVEQGSTTVTNAVK